jgi:hypothetical protein
VSFLRMLHRMFSRGLTARHSASYINRGLQYPLKTRFAPAASPAHYCCATMQVWSCSRLHISVQTQPVHITGSSELHLAGRGEGELGNHCTFAPTRVCVIKSQSQHEQQYDYTRIKMQLSFTTAAKRELAHWEGDKRLL